MESKYRELGRHGFTVIFKIEDGKYKVETYMNINDLKPIQNNIVYIINGYFKFKLNRIFTALKFGEDYVYTLPANFQSFIPEHVKDHSINCTIEQLFTTFARLKILNKPKPYRILH